MLVNPAIFILLVVSVFALALVILFIITSYNHLIKKIEQADEEKVHAHDAATEHAENLLNEARERHLELIEEANKEANEIISQASTLKTQSIETSQQTLDTLIRLQKEALEKMSRDLHASYNASLQKLEQKDVQAFEEISKDVEGVVSQEMKEFTDTIKKETVDSHKIIEERLEEQYAKAEKEIALYKQEQLKKIDAAAFPLLKNVTGILLGRSLTPSDQQDLILQAMEQAKKELAGGKN